MVDGGARSDQFALVKDKVDANIESFRKRRDLSRSRAFRLRIAIVVIGAATTIVLGLKTYVGFENSDKILSAVALVLSAIVPVFAAWEAFFDYRWLWVRYTTTLNSLYNIRDELDYAQSAAGPEEKSTLDKLFMRLQQTLEEGNLQWEARRRTKENK